MITITGIRFCIEFSSILVLIFLCIMHEFTDVTILAKQFTIDRPSTNNEVNLNNADESTLHLADDNRPVVKFTPESLDFHSHPISTPVIKTVYVHNSHEELSIQMISISGNTEHFHCSFFEDKIVPPGANTSFQVVFLARQEGLVNNTLYIHSSVGSFQYHVSAYGEASPFRVRPLIGARIPLNSSFASLIYIYNPFSTPLQLTEMYTSGGGLHLELPNDDLEAPSSLWKVPPYETRPVMKAHFVALIASNHTSYIRIQTNATDVQLMLPVEVEVSNSPGLYSPLDTLDFGVLRSRHDPPKTLPIQVINAAMKFIYVQSIVVTPLSEGLTVEFDGPVKLPPRSITPFNIANLILDPSQFICTGLCFGKVLIKSKNNQYKLSIPFVVRIIQGELYFNHSLSHFFINQSSNFSEQRTLTVENRFDSDIVVHEILLPNEAKPYFKLSMTPPYQLPVVLPVGQPCPLLTVKFTLDSQLNHFSTIFRLLTNHSYFDLPLYAYRGRLDLFIPNSSDQTRLDLGLVGLNEHKSSLFVLSNHNPIAIRLERWTCNLNGTTIEFVGTSQGNATSPQQRIALPAVNQFRSETTLLQPNHYAVFRVHVNNLTREGVHRGILTVNTLYERIKIPLSLNVLRGSLSANKVTLPKSFPGRVVSAYLTVKSNYTSEIKLKGATVEPKDSRFRLNLSELTVIKPGEDNHIQIVFDAAATCSQRICYSALDIEKEVGHLWLLGSGLYSDTAYIDKELYRLLRNQWLMHSESDRNPAVNVRLQVDGFGSFTTEAQAQLQWPRLSNKLVIKFPSVRIGRMVTKELMVENPADRAILIQAINVVDYPNSDVLLQLMSSNVFHQQWSRVDLDSIETNLRLGHNSSAFVFANNSSASVSSNRINQWLGVSPNTNSFTMILPPGARQRLSIAFHPLDERNFTSLLILRNNLTVIEVVMLRGEGGRGLLKIGKTLPNTPDSQLSFEFSERLLEKKCRLSADRAAELNHISHSPNILVIKEKFKATNVGRMGLQIRNFLIDGSPCEGFGFHMSRCEPLFLMPNQSFDIEMIYSPDFTQPMVNHELTIIVDDDPAAAQRFQLVAHLPKIHLANCLRALPRPQWEDFIYYLLLFMALLVLLLSVVVAISDARRISIATIALLAVETSVSTDSRSEVCKNSINKTNSTNENGKLKQAVDSSISTPNGKPVTFQQAQTNLNKVRNRRGNKTTTTTVSNQNTSSSNITTTMAAAAHSNSNSSSRNLNKPANVTPLNLITQNKREQSPKERAQSVDSTQCHLSQPPLDYSESVSWSNVMKKKLLRQDSSSSEQSQRSVDNSSPSSSRNTDKESDILDSNEWKRPDHLSEHSIVQKGSSQSSFIEKKSKHKMDNKDVHDTKKLNMDKKANKFTKLQKQNALDKDKTPRLQSQHSSGSDTSKSSSEPPNACSKMRHDNTTGTKTRAATLPFANDSKSSQLSNESMSMSQSDIATNQKQDKYPMEQHIAPIGTKSHKHTVSSKLELKSYLNNNNNNELLIGRTNNNRNELSFSKPNDNFSHNNGNNWIEQDQGSERFKDIWDLAPHDVNNFDSEAAMNLLVKQTEKFAADGKQYGFNRMNSIRKPVSNDRASSCNNTKLSEDKWEIGEWSNDLAIGNGGDGFRNVALSDSLSTTDAQINRFGAKTSRNNRFESRLEHQSTNRNYRPSGGINNNKNNVNSNLFSPLGPSVSPVTTSGVPESFAPSNSTFSPVIGRPAPSASSALLSSSKPSSSRMTNFPNNGGGQSSFDSFFDSFPLPSTNQFNSDLLDLFSNPTTTQYPASLGERLQSNSLLPSQAGKTNNNMNSLLDTNNWNRPSMSNFSNSYLSSDSISNNTPIFDFENREAAWNSSLSSNCSSWANFANSAISNTKASSFQPGFGTINVNNVSDWPSTAITSDGYGQTKLNQTSCNSANNRVWSPFDNIYSNPNPTQQMSQPKINSEGSSSIFENSGSVFELFGAKSPWSPLSSSPSEEKCHSHAPNCDVSGVHKSGSSSVLHGDSFIDHFPLAPSPTSSNSSTLGQPDKPTSPSRMN